jgi:hypothetical protein
LFFARFFSRPSRDLDEFNASPSLANSYAALINSDHSAFLKRSALFTGITLADSPDGFGVAIAIFIVSDVNG